MLSPHKKIAFFPRLLFIPSFLLPTGVNVASGRLAPHDLFHFLVGWVLGDVVGILNVTVVSFLILPHVWQSFRYKEKIIDISFCLEYKGLPFMDACLLQLPSSSKGNDNGSRFFTIEYPLAWWLLFCCCHVLMGVRASGRFRRHIFGWMRCGHCVHGATPALFGLFLHSLHGIAPRNVRHPHLCGD